MGPNVKAILLPPMLALAATCGAVLALPAPPAMAVEPPAFDPVLSLRGDALTDPTDEIPDPGPNHPPKKFDDSCGVATDSFGNIYVASGASASLGVKGRIDIFNPQGEFLTEIPDPRFPCQLAVDSEGNLYVAENGEGENPAVVRFAPSAYPPTTTTTYTRDPEPIETGFGRLGVAVDPSNDHVYVALTLGGAVEHDSAANGSGIIGTDESQRLTIDATGGTFTLLYGPGEAGTGTLSAGSPIVSAVVAASGTGNLTAGSTEVTAVKPGIGSFEAGNPISGPGIPPETSIVEATRGAGGEFIRLSKAATVSIASTALSSESTGRFNLGNRIVGPGIPPGTRIESLGPGADTLTLSANATASATAVELFGFRGEQDPAQTPPLPFDASAAAVQTSLEGLPEIGVGNVVVTGGPGGPGASPYQVTFTGSLANTDTPQLGVDASNLNGTARTTVIAQGFDGRIGAGLLANSSNADVYGATHDLYLSGSPVDASEALVARVYIIDGTDGHRKRVLDGADTPKGSFKFTFGRVGIAVDQATGNFYVADFPVNHVVDQFDSSGEFLTSFTHSFIQSEPSSDIAVDTGAFSPNKGYVYVTSGFQTSNSHLYAFAPPPPPLGPEVRNEVASQISATSAVLEAEVNPNAKATRYRFEYGLANCSANPCASVPDAQAGAGSSFVGVSREIRGLQPDTTYHFRLLAENCEEGDEGSECEVVGEDRTFRTFPVAVRGLPDGRAYELVTPPDTNGRIPTSAVAIGTTQFNGFASDLATPDGQSLMFGTDGGTLPGFEGTGHADAYRAIRTATGWQTRAAGPNGTQMSKNFPGGVSPDHGFSFWNATGVNGSLADPVTKSANYLREPDGSFTPIGIGSLGLDPRPEGRLITADAGHVIFVTGAEGPAVQLEPNAPPAGTAAIYDRSPAGPTHVVSLLPGDVTPTTAATYEGASADGTAVAFVVADTLYVRVDNSQTRLVSGGSPTFAGLSENGDRLFYLRDGDLFAFDTGSGQVTPIGSGGESTVVNVSADGSHLYFVSPQQLDGAEGAAGAENLYAWEDEFGAVNFIAELAPGDVVGEVDPFTGDLVGGLGLWVKALGGRTFDQNRWVGPSVDPSRTTPDGVALVFESRADLLPPFESDGHRQIYRYDAGQESLVCISCSPTGEVPSSDAQLQSNPAEESVSLPPANAISNIANITEDGGTVFFQSDERLVPSDADGVTDVYEWKEQGSGGCGREGGCLALISSGASGAPSYLYAMTPDGRDVFFETGDMLVPQDSSDAPSIYDARVGGGFPVLPELSPCQGDSCQGGPRQDPPAPVAGTAVFQGSGNPPQGRRHKKARHPKKKHRKGHGRHHKQTHRDGRTIR